MKSFARYYWKLKIFLWRFNSWIGKNDKGKRESSYIRNLQLEYTFKSKTHCVYWIRRKKSGLSWCISRISEFINYRLLRIMFQTEFNEIFVVEISWFIRYKDIFLVPYFITTLYILIYQPNFLDFCELIQVELHKNC